MFVAHVHSECDHYLVTAFRCSLTRSGWNLFLHDVKYPSFGNSIDDRAHFIIDVNKLVTRVHHPVVVPTPPLSTSQGLAHFIHPPFNRHKFSVSPSRHDAAFADFVASSHTPISTVAIGNSTQSKRIYNLV